MKALRQKANRTPLRRFEFTFEDPCYAGSEKVPPTRIEAAAKRPPGGRLSDEEIARNRWIFSKRFVVERGNASSKTTAS